MNIFVLFELCLPILCKFLISSNVVYRELAMNVPSFVRSCVVVDGRVSTRSVVVLIRFSVPSRCRHNKTFLNYLFFFN